MKPQNCLKTYKCYCFQTDNYCNCPIRIISGDVLIANVSNTAESLLEIMKLCGISMEKAKEISDVIVYYFLHFEEIIHRIDSIPRKRLNKKDLMYDLGRKCSMNRVEAQLTYSIVKRAFKAFYHGNGLEGVSLTHNAECLWVHAAQRTAQVYASYEGLFRTDQKDLECKIKRVYKQLYDRISSRDQPDGHHECIKRIGKETLKSVESRTDFHVLDYPYESVYLKEQEKHAGTQSSEKGTETVNIGNPRCTCLSLNVSTKNYVDRINDENIKFGSSRGSFECKWISISKEEFEADEVDMDIKMPKEYPCSPCYSVEECSTECECTCEDCSCKTESEMACVDEVGIEKEFVSKEFSMPSQHASISDESLYGIYDNAIF